MRILEFGVAQLSVPLVEPFVIASGRIDATRAARVRVVLADADGRVTVGLGEAAALPPVTREDQPELLARLGSAGTALVGAELHDLAALRGALDEALGESPVARAGAEAALLDAWARHAASPLCAWLGARRPRMLTTDITLPIAEPEHLAELARGHRARGFSVFKVKVGRSLDDDVAALTAVHQRVPDATFRLDANAGFVAGDALALCRAARQIGAAVECFEQPCGRDDLAGMAEVTAHSGVPVVADESVHTLVDLERVVRARAAHGVNLKLVKSGGLLAALALGRAALQQGLGVMCGGMVETRLGMASMAQVACALERVDYVDLDTAFLLAADPFEGGYVDDGPRLMVTDAHGIGVSERVPLDEERDGSSRAAR